MRRAAARPLAGVGLLGLLALLAACGSVTAIHTDGGSGGARGDSSVKTDVAVDRQAEDAHHDVAATHDATSPKDLAVGDTRPTDAHPGDAPSRGGSGGGMSGAGGGGAGGGTAGECQSNADCVLYPKLGSGCCGVCQPKGEPQPPPVQCLIACLNPLVTCGCVNQQCVGSTKQL